MPYDNAFEQGRHGTPDDVREAKIEKGLVMTKIGWSSDWEAAPKDGKTKVLILFPDGVITTGCFYWYTEDSYENFKAVAYWSLHDLVRDDPLDENGPVEESGLRWAPFPEGL
jgi:hypothetical protein